MNLHPIKTLLIEEMSTSKKKVIETEHSKVSFYPTYFTWELESVVEQEIPIDDDLEGDTSLEEVPEYVYCLVLKSDVKGFELSWNQVEKLFVLSIVCSSFAFTCFSPTKRPLQQHLSVFKQWLFNEN